MRSYAQVRIRQRAVSPCRFYSSAKYVLRKTGMCTKKSSSVYLGRGYKVITHFFTMSYHAFTLTTSPECLTKALQSGEECQPACIKKALPCAWSKLVLILRLVNRFCYSSQTAYKKKWNHVYNAPIYRSRWHHLKTNVFLKGKFNQK